MYENSFLMNIGKCRCLCYNLQHYTCRNVTDV
uniref:Uncharacterized protein n=1 Tax=Anguilla anguilla TaxID=7936 RepID=A0A0E9U895_ANGAN